MYMASGVNSAFAEPFPGAAFADARRSAGWKANEVGEMDPPPPLTVPRSDEAAALMVK